MRVDPTPAELSHAEVAGAEARKNGRECKPPTWAIGEQGRAWRDRWIAGWKSEDARHVKSKGARNGK